MTTRKTIVSKTTTHHNTYLSSEVICPEFITTGPQTISGLDGIIGVSMKINAGSLQMLVGSEERDGVLKLMDAFQYSFEHNYAAVRKTGFYAHHGRLAVSITRSLDEWSQYATVEPTVITVAGTSYTYVAGLYYQQTTKYKAEKIEIKATKGVTLDYVLNQSHSLKNEKTQVISFGFTVNIGEITAGVSLLVTKESQFFQSSVPEGSFMQAQVIDIDGGTSYTDNGNTIFETKKLKLKANEFTIKAAYAKFIQKQRISATEVGLKFGIYNNLAFTLRSVQNAAQAIKNSDFSSEESATLSGAALGLAAYGVYQGYVMGLAAIATGQIISIGASAYIKHSHSTMKAEQLQALVSFYHADILEVEAVTIWVEGVQLYGASGFIQAKSLLIKNAFNSYEGQSEQFHVNTEAGFSSSGGFAGAGFGHSHGKQHGWKSVTTHIKFSDSLQFSISGTMSVTGAVIDAKSIKLSAASLLLASVQDLASSSGSGFDLGFSSKVENAVSQLGANMQSGSKAWVGELTRIMGQEKLEIVLGGTLNMIASMIGVASARGDDDTVRLVVKAAELFTQDLYGYDDGITLAASVSRSAPNIPGSDNPNPLGNSYSGQFGAHAAKQIARATITKGEVYIGDVLQTNPPYNQDLAYALTDETTFDAKRQSFYYTETKDEQAWNKAKEQTKDFWQDPLGNLKDGAKKGFASAKEQAKKMWRDFSGTKPEPTPTAFEDMLASELKRLEQLSESQVAAEREQLLDKARESLDDTTYFKLKTYLDGTTQLAFSAPLTKGVVVLSQTQRLILQAITKDIVSHGTKHATELLKTLVEKLSDGYILEKSKAKDGSPKVTFKPGDSTGSSGGMPDPDDEDGWNKNANYDAGKLEKWEVKQPSDADKVMRHDRFGKFYRDPEQKLGNKDIWWTKDNAEHGGSKYKLFVRNGDKLDWVADVDEFGKVMSKHKGGKGKVIELKDLIGIK